MAEKKIILAKSAGFCFGVKKAVDRVYEESSKDSVYTYGPIIHNEEVVKDLEARKVYVVDGADDQRLDEASTVIIRSHGVSRNVYEELEKRGVDIVDATCPFVLKIHRIVEEESKAGKQIVIIGDEKHPEVEGIVGWVSGKAYVINSHEQAQTLNLDPNKPLVIVSQTTFNLNKFQVLVEIIDKKGYNSIIRNTICNATEERQTEAREIARDADAMIVIGGRSSSNTRKLYEICKNECENTFLIQTVSDLDLKSLGTAECIGITAGASTPNKIIEEVYTNVRDFCTDVRGIN